MTGRPQAIGRYMLFGQLAAGGQASVHLGRVTGPAGFIRAVAVKRVRADRSGDERARAMMLDEARLASRVQHPNVVQTLDVVWHEGELVLVMELVQGESLARLMRSATGTFGVPVPVAISILAGALRGLHAAHEAVDAEGHALHLVHRDLSPQNIIVDVHGVAKVLDFGVAKARGRSQDDTDLGVVKGKPSYMAPEQVHGTADRRADLWAIGVVLWECLAGAKLFTGQTDGEVLGKMLSLPIPSLRSMGRPVTEALETVVMRALSRDLDQRYATAEAMAEALEQLGPATPQQVARWVVDVAGESIEKTKQAVRHLESTTDSVIEGDELVSLDRVETQSTTTRRLPYLLGVAFLLGLGGAGLFVVGRESARPTPAIVIPTPVTVVDEPPSVVDAGATPLATATPTPEAHDAGPSTVAVAPPPVDAGRPSRPPPVRVVVPTRGKPDAGTTRPLALRNEVPSKQPACDPPYRFVNGIKQWLPECFKNKPR